jgi:hypothetical protein
MNNTSLNNNSAAVSFSTSHLNNLKFPHLNSFLLNLSHLHRSSNSHHPFSNALHF